MVWLGVFEQLDYIYIQYACCFDILYLLVISFIYEIKVMKDEKGKLFFGVEGVAQFFTN